MNEENLFTEKLIITSVNDIDKTIQKVLNSKNDYFELKIDELEPIVFRFIGERFNREFVPIKTAEISAVYKTNFVKYYNNILQTKVDEDLLYFRYKPGSFEVDFQQFLAAIIDKGISKMSGTQITLIILFAIGAWFAKDAYSDYLDAQKAKFNSDVALKAIEVLERNIELQNAKNKPVNKALEIINESEELEYGNIKDKTTYKKNDISKFETLEDEQITYETIEGQFFVKGMKDIDGKKYITLKRGKEAKFEAVSKLSNNNRLFESFETGTPIKLKINIGKDSKGKIVEADIYEIVD